jgi:hypothetical protein
MNLIERFHYSRSTMVLTYLVSILLFSFIFFYTDGLNPIGCKPIATDDVPACLEWYDYIYFSVVTITTLGFGEITPQTWLAKLFVVVLVLFGLYIMGMLISTTAWKFQKKFFEELDCKRDVERFKRELNVLCMQARVCRRHLNLMGFNDAFDINRFTNLQENDFIDLGGKIKNLKEKSESISNILTRVDRDFVVTNHDIIKTILRLGLDFNKNHLAMDALFCGGNFNVSDKLKEWNKVHRYATTIRSLDLQIEAFCNREGLSIWQETADSYGDGANLI